MSAEIVTLSGIGFKVMESQLLMWRVRDFSPVLSQAKSLYMQPMARRAWASSGLKSKSGALKKAITPFSGKSSLGVWLRTSKGKDLVLAKANVHTYGRKKHENRQGINRKTGARRRPSPWGDIPARPFMPVIMPAGYRTALERKIRGYVNGRLERNSR